MSFDFAEDEFSSDDEITAGTKKESSRKVPNSLFQLLLVEHEKHATVRLPSRIG